MYISNLLETLLQLWLLENNPFLNLNKTFILAHYLGSADFSGINIITLHSNTFRLSEINNK